MSRKLPFAIRPQAVAALAISLLATLVPSFITDLVNPERRRRPPKLHPTSYLDGLRGLAAFAVFAFHYTDYNHKTFLPHYGSNPEATGSSILQLPFIRIIYSGTPMVHVFFVISGFALACRPLQCLYDQSSTSTRPSSAGVAKAHAVLASSALRRPIRLFVPPLAVTFMTAMIIQLDYLHGYMKPKESLFKAIYEWATDAFYNITWPWTWEAGSIKSRYNPHLWTIPIEFTHSMLLFLVVFALAPLRTARVRHFALVCIMVYSILSACWAAFEFMGGALLADMYCAKQHRNNDAATHDQLTLLPMPTTSTSHESTCATAAAALLDSKMIARVPVAKLLHIAKNTTRVAVLIASAFIISWPPRRGDMTPTYLWLETLVPSSFVKENKPELASSFWLSMAAFGTVWASGRIRWFKRLLNAPLPQYAGRISFCFYIMQHTILNLLQHPVLGSTAKPANGDKPGEPAWGVRGTFGNDTPVERTITWTVGLVILGSVVVVMADLFTRVLDAPAVRLARTLEGVVCRKDEPRNGAMQEK